MSQNLVNHRHLSLIQKLAQEEMSLGLEQDIKKISQIVQKKFSLKMRHHVASHQQRYEHMRNFLLSIMRGAHCLKSNNL